LNPKNRKEVKCPKCGNGWNGRGFDFETKDIEWIPNGKTFLIGGKLTKAYEPFPKKVICNRCGKVFIVEYYEREKVEFT